MPTRTRVLAFGSAAALVVAGAVCGAVIGGSTGGALALGLITVGLGGVVLLAFFEVGLSEDRERARDAERQANRTRRRVEVRRRRSPRPRWPRRGP